MSSDSRPNPDELLARVQAEEAKSQHGKLKIFFGAAPGVGKTYAMLEAARKVAKEGANVIVGYVEPHARPETQALVLGLDVLPKRTVTYRGRQLLEFDLDAALAEKPQLIVVDELAHTNLIDDERPLVHAKRWQDIPALMATHDHLARADELRNHDGFRTDSLSAEPLPQHRPASSGPRGECPQPPAHLDSLST